MTLFNLFRIIEKGGPGSGRYPKGSGKSNIHNSRTLQKELDTVKKEFDYNGDIVYGGKGDDFEIEGSTYTTQASYDQKTKVITVFDDGFTSGVVKKGILAHEIEHSKFHNFLDTANKERLLFDEDRTKRYIPQQERKEKYPKFMLLSDITNVRRSQLMDNGRNVSLYTRDYWDKYKKNRDPNNLLLAINETLAETANLKHSGKNYPEYWDKLSKEIEGVG